MMKKIFILLAATAATTAHAENKLWCYEIKITNGYYNRDFNTEDIAKFLRERDLTKTCVDLFAKDIQGSSTNLDKGVFELCLTGQMSGKDVTQLKQRMVASADPAKCVVSISEKSASVKDLKLTTQIDTDIETNKNGPVYAFKDAALPTLCNACTTGKLTDGWNDFMGTGGAREFLASQGMNVSSALN